MFPSEDGASYRLGLTELLKSQHKGVSHLLHRFVVFTTFSGDRLGLTEIIEKSTKGIFLYPRQCSLQKMARTV